MTRVARNLTIALALCGPFVTACSREGDLTGDVFIVTKGGENYKLGLVTVSALPAEAVQSAVKTQHEKADVERAKLAPERKKAEAASNEATLEHDRVYKAYLADISNTKKEAEYNADSKKHQAAQSTVWDLEKKLTDLDSADYFFEALPDHVASAKTDADGKFKLTLPTRGRYALLAKSTRVVGSSTEKYYWLVWVSLDGQASKHMTLSNDNLWGQDSEDAVVTSKSLPNAKQRP